MIWAWVLDHLWVLIVAGLLFYLSLLYLFVRNEDRIARWLDAG